MNMEFKPADIETGKTGKPTTSSNFRKNLSEYFSDFSRHTSIHGVGFLGRKNLSTFEKLWWFVTICISIVLCSLLITKTYDKWVNSPVIVSFAKTSTPIWQIPFPAVTICPETKAKQRVYNFTDVYYKFHETPENMTQAEIEEFERISLVCNNHIYSGGNKTMDYDEGLNSFEKVGPPFDEIFWMCRWLNQNETCGTLFTPLLTDEGVCYTFNTLDREDLFTDQVFTNGTYLQHGLQATQWDLEEGYLKEASVEVFPRRALAAGHAGSFGIVLRLYGQDLDYICKGPVQGFKILLHNPAELPTISQQYFWAPLDSNIVVSIIPHMMTTSNGLKAYDYKIRKCYFSYERPLQYFKDYTQGKCEIECLTNYTLKACGCVAFYMPRNETTNICGSGSVTCMEASRKEVNARELRFNTETYENASGLIREQRCNCLPSCSSLSYNIESSQADFNIPKVFEAFRVNESEFPGVRITRVDMFFRQPQFFTHERNELYGITQFLSHCGGLLGLFVGFSILSLIEIFYWLTLRLICNIKEYGLRYWSGSRELIKDT